MTSAIVAADHLLDGVSALDVSTARLRQRVLVPTRCADALLAGEAERVVVLAHGSLSSSLIFQRLLLALAEARPQVVPIALDFRGFGGTEPAPVDATRGLRDLSDDLLALLDALDVPAADLLGWSMGAGVVARAAADAPGRARTLTLLAPISPFGFGGTSGPQGRLTTPEAAGTGSGGTVWRFAWLLAAKSHNGWGTRLVPELFSPRGVIRAMYTAPRLLPWPDENLWVTAMCTTHVSPDHYPGDMRFTWRWPYFAPGRRGILNAMSPLYCRWDDLVDSPARPPILWMRGDLDIVASDLSLLDTAVVSGAFLAPWIPFAATASHPMVSQTRAVLDRYVRAGGRYEEVVLPGVGHSVHLESPTRVLEALLAHLDRVPVLTR